jgi:small subunit ribosomal protein S10
LIDAAAKKIMDVVNASSASVYGPVPLPTHRELFTIIRPTHKYKDSREQFELRTHKRVIGIEQPSNEVIDKLQRLSIPAGVTVEIK